ncbi:MAG: preprotein translocase subunit SecE [Chitinispirillales bacterium]|jgi:preprotein translocase subunit SecE|nr:preprotein translocase subunit SecE [Chitinispirillales bacterium]
MMQKIIQYLRDVRSEVAKVNWPTKDDISAGTVLVIILSIVVSIYVFVCDQGLQAAIGLFLRAR